MGYGKKILTAEGRYFSLRPSVSLSACIIWNYRWQPQMETRPDMHIIVSGSSAELLSRELGTLLTGRHLDVEMFRLDLSECMRFHGIDPEDPLEEPYLLFFIGTYSFQIEKKSHVNFNGTIALL